MTEGAVKEIEQALEEEQKTEEQVKFDFDDEFQRKIAALCLRSTKFARRTDGLIKPDYFECDARAYLVDIANSYFTQYRCIPDSRSTLVHYVKEKLNDSKVRSDFRAEITKELKSLLQEKLTDADYIADQVGRFAKHQAIQNALLESVELVDKGDIDAVESIMLKASKVGVVEDFSAISYWNDIDRRTQYRNDMHDGKIPKRGITTGIGRLDKLLYHLGWGRQELSVLMGGAKRGKSTGLGFFANLSSISGYNTLYLSCEVSEDIIAERNDANNSKTPMHELEGRADEVAERLKVKNVDKNGEYEIIAVPSGSLSPSGLRRILERYKADGIKFDAIYVDYADIMRPDVFTSSEIENSKNIWLGLRAIAYEEDAAVITATQTNRDGFKNDTAKAEHAAEDFNKIRIADLVISINRSEEEKAKGEARLYFAASRNQAGEFTVGIKQNMETMEFITKINGVS